MPPDMKVTILANYYYYYLFITPKGSHICTIHRKNYKYK